MAINRRDEKFEINDGNVLVRVHNTAQPGRVDINLERGFTRFVAGMTPDEADQLAEMLRLSARDARSRVIRAAGLGVQEPPDDPRIYNRKREDGTYPPLSGFFDR